MPDGAVLEFGSRSGCYVALALFGPMFAALGFGVFREIRRRAPSRRRTAWVAGALLAACPLTLLYSTSLGGFYEAELRDGRLILHHLHPRRTEIRLSDVAGVRAAPAFKGRWRLRITDVRGVVRESATSNRDVAMAAEGLLRSVIRP